MPNSLIVCVGASCQGLVVTDFLRKNASVLKGVGIGFPPFAPGVFARHSFLTDEARKLAATGNTGLVKKFMCAQLAPVVERNECCIIGASFCRLKSGLDDTLLTSKGLVEAFEKIRPKVVIPFVDVAEEVELHIAAIKMFSLKSYAYNIARIEDLHEFIPSSYIIRQLQTQVGHESIHAYDALSPYDRSGIPIPVAAVLESAGISPEAVRRAGADFSSPRNFPTSMPREVAGFASAANAALLFREEKETNPQTLRWISQFPRFTPESGYVSDRYSWLGPEGRKHWRRRFAAEDTKLAESLGLSLVYTDPEPEPGWEPFSGMTPETAYRVASRLERGFALEIQRDLEAVPLHFRSHDQRVCLEALHDTVTYGNEAPFPKFISKPPKVTVLTLCYNHAAYLGDMIESVAAQRTNFPIRHIIVDDASTDNSQEIVEKYATKYPHITPLFIPDKTWPQVYSAQALFEMAKSPYVALCEGDDYFTDPRKLQIQADFLDAHPDAALCFHPVRVLFEGEPARERVYPPESALPGGVQPFYTLDDLIRGNIIQTNSVMYRWRFARGLPEWFRPWLCPGDWYWHLLHAEMGKVGYIDTVMSVYRRHPNAMYYEAEINSAAHSYKKGLQKLQMYAALDEHFRNEFTEILSDLADGVITEIVQYATEKDDVEMMDRLVDKYPEFMQHFFTSLKKSGITL